MRGRSGNAGSWWWRWEMIDDPESRHRVKAAELIGRAIRKVRNRRRRERAARCDSKRVEMLGWTPETAWKYPKL